MRSIESRRPERTSTKGGIIRAKIAHNRDRRLAIAAAMKREAGVRRHDVNFVDLSGRADFTGDIFSPEGVNIAQLYTVAHECGHVFLHSEPPGLALPTHVKELEAESYAHQAFRAHGMRVPASDTQGAREYVASWIQKDRASGLEIDPRALAFALGERCPFESLRMTPQEWGLENAGRRPSRLRNPAVRANWQPGQRAGVLAEARSMLASAGLGMLYGVFAADVGLKLINIMRPLPELFVGPYADPTPLAFGVFLCAGLVVAMLHIAIRHPISGRSTRRD